MDYKTQTSNTTEFKTNIKNINIFVNKDLEIGVTSKYWGDFEPREEALIELQIEGKKYVMGQKEFSHRIVQSFDFKGD
ncbi:MAG: hypothetical protein EOL97_14515 [Spirochaetia bacterium]|nr:hypothetical protein [Spirochaetia bacterium]